MHAFRALRAGGYESDGVGFDSSEEEEEEEEEECGACELGAPRNALDLGALLEAAQEGARPSAAPRAAGGGGGGGGGFSEAPERGEAFAEELASLLAIFPAAELALLPPNRRGGRSRSLRLSCGSATCILYVPPAYPRSPPRITMTGPRGAGGEEVAAVCQSLADSHAGSEEPYLFQLLTSLHELLRKAAAAAAAAPAADAAEQAALRYNFISCLIVSAQNGFGRDVEPFLALCHETWDEEILWDAVKDLPHGALPEKWVEDRAGRPAWFSGRGYGYPLKLAEAAKPYGKRRTRLMYAAQAGDAQRVRWLLARGAQLALEDHMGRTALDWACAAGREVTVRVLVEAGAAFEGPPLHFAAQWGFIGMLREALAGGAAVDATNEASGATPLHEACARGRVEAARELLARGAAVNARMRAGDTPLISAVIGSRGETTLVEALLAHGADRHAKTKKGASAITCARDFGFKRILELLGVFVW